MSTLLSKLAAALRYLADLIDPPTVAAPSDPLMAAAVQLVNAQTGPESGEWKRHVVYAALIKQFPQTSKKTLGMAIELAVQGLD